MAITDEIVAAPRERQVDWWSGDEGVVGVVFNQDGQVLQATDYPVVESFPLLDRLRRLLPW